MEDWIIDGVRYTTEPTELCYDDLKALSDKRLVLLNETVEELERWVEIADKRLELLKRLEWTPLYFSTLKKIIYTCVVCSQSKEDGHTDDCELAEAIAEE